MTAETIIKKIKTDSELTIKKINENVERKVKEIRKQAEKQAEEQAEHIYNNGIQQAENRKKILISQAHQNAKRNEMNAKEEIIETCFQKAIQQLSNLKKRSYKKLVKQLIKQGQKQIPGSCTLLISNEKDKQLAKELNIPVTGSIQSSGGIILKSKNGNITIDNTFEGIINREKPSIRIIVGKHLFK